MSLVKEIIQKFEIKDKFEIINVDMTGPQWDPDEYTLDEYWEEMESSEFKFDIKATLKLSLYEETNGEEREIYGFENDDYINMYIHGRFSFDRGYHIKAEVDDNTEEEYQNVVSCSEITDYIIKKFYENNSTIAKKALESVGNPPEQPMCDFGCVTESWIEWFKEPIYDELSDSWK